MRFLVTSTVIASPLLGLYACVILEASPREGPARQPAAVIARSTAVDATDDPGVTGALPVVVTAAARDEIRRWRRSIAPTPVQGVTWSRLGPVTARILSAGCRAQSAEPWVRRSWLAFAQGLSPRQRIVYQREIVPRLWGATHPRGCSVAHLS